MSDKVPGRHGGTGLSRVLTLPGRGSHRNRETVFSGRIAGVLFLRHRKPGGSIREGKKMNPEKEHRDPG
jgi:hypothetical protein